MIMSRLSPTPSKTMFYMYMWILCATCMSLLPGILLAKAVSSNLSFKSPSGCHLLNTSLGVKATCTHLGLRSVPEDLPSNTITLDLSYNNLTTLFNKSFANLADIITLGIRHNFLSKIEEGVFAPLVHLTVVSLQGNKLISLQPGLFDRNHILSILIVNRNRFTSILSALPWSKSITKLDLSANQISHINPHDFIRLENCSLKTLDLTLNVFTDIPPNAFSYLSKIDHLVLDSNTLSEFYISSLLGKTEIKSLQLVGCKIHAIIPLNHSQVSLNDFPTIYHLNMEGNKLHTLQDFVFWGLNQTYILEIQQNSISKIYNKSFCGLHQMIELDLSFNQLATLDYGTFSCNKMLQRISLAHNKMASFSNGILLGLPLLNYLDLSQNALENVDTNGSLSNPSIEYLDLSFNKFKIIKKSFQWGFTNLKILNVSQNEIHNVYSSYTFTKLIYLKELYLKHETYQGINTVFAYMQSLLHLDISFSELRILSESPFANTSSLETLIMRENGLKSVDLFPTWQQKSIFVGLKSLVRLDLRGNDLDNLNPRTFNPLRRLQKLLLSESSIKALNPGVFESLLSLTFLDLHHNEILRIPVGLLQMQQNLAVLYISNNKLKSIPRTLFNATSSLHSLYLQGNKITTIKPNTIFVTNRTLTLHASDNPFSCTCELSWFIQWLQASTVELSHPEDTLCSHASIKEQVDKPILSFHPNQYCGINIVMVTSVSLSLVLVVVICLVAYRKRWWFNYKFFLINLAIFGYEEVNQDFDDQGYEYHLNVMYIEEDQEWVDQVMKPVLQERFPHLQNVVFGDNDLNLGMFLINALHHAVDNSFKTVILISYNSVDDAWFLTKLRIALENLNDTRLDKVILIFLEDIQGEHLPYLARLFLSKNKPYMLWTDDADGQELFWAQFEKSMRGNRVLNSVIPV